ncbi:MAG: hypothetical protein ABIM89_16375 [Mycobacteriales bacterium]
MSRAPRSWSRSSRASVLVVLALTATLAACGGSETSTGSSGSAKSSGSSDASSNTQDTAQVKLTQCLREQGVNVPDTAGHGAFAQLSPADRRKLEAALQGPCREYQSSAFGDSADPQSEEFLDALTKFAVCMRSNGVDVPDPVASDPQGPFAILHELDQSDPKIAKASSACQDKLPQQAPAG